MSHQATTFEKRLKRRVSGRLHTFFISTAPGFESLCQQALMALRPDIRSIGKVNGGVIFEGKSVDCYLANLELRTANRILMRIGRFTATHFKQLANRLTDLEWELYLPKGTVPSVKVTTHRSRLYHTDAIADRVKQSITQRLHGGGTQSLRAGESTITPGVFVRAEDNYFTISVDSSGDNLYKRGIKQHGGKAPLRETIAAAALTLAGYNGREPLCDPMCGSGTFSLEGAMMAKNIPPGWFRTFAFIDWPAFRQRQWNYLKQKAGNKIRAYHKPTIFASDTDANACHRLVQTLQPYDLTDVVRVSHENFFDLKPHHFTKSRGLITLNPPYGRRMGSQRESRKRIGAICEKIALDFSGWKVVIIAPEKSWLKKMPFDLSVRTVFHGGLKLFMLIGMI